MKTAESSTKRNKKTLADQRIDFAADVTTQYLKYWTDKELKRLTIDENLPVCLPLGNRGFLIGSYKVLSVGQHCWRVLDRNDELVHDFGRKLSAVFYCLTTQANKLNLARDIMTTDARVSRLEIDQDNYANSRKLNLKKKDYFRADLANMRYINNRYQLHYANEELEKTINTAKYLKVQERLL
jgi:hypothetical protein